MTSRIFRLSRAEVLWLAVILAALLVIYLPGLGNALVFDDAVLTDGAMFASYGGLELRVRMLSYGSFVWLQALAGEGWWKQRVANLAIHMAVVVALLGLYREVLRHIALPPEPGRDPAHPAEGYEKSPALWIAIGFFAINPAAVYAVAYLIQRSILLATFFVVLGLWTFTRAVAEKKPALHVLAAACYVLAVLSKEHAILAPLAAVPLYIVVARPGVKRLAMLAAGGAVMVGAVGLVLRMRYGEILGKPFDEFSHIYLDQLSRLDPDAVKNAYPLSIMNQAYLFFEYGLRWLVPWTGWMSINMRPVFPVTWLTFPQLAGAIAYLALIVAGFVLVIRYRDWRALLGLAVLFPALLFATEFATVWVQDPFVIYRSYLWAIGIPGIAFFFFHGFPPRVAVAISLVLGSLLGWQSIDRVLSLSTPERAFGDAIAKLPDDPRAVGRWFPYLNRGNAYFESDQMRLAAKDFEASSKLGDRGIGSFNIGAILMTAGKPQQALAAFDLAARQGYTLYNLPFQRGTALLALGKVAEAHAQFQAALEANPPSPVRELVLLSGGRTAVQLGRREEAKQKLEALLAADPKNKEGRYLLAMTFISGGEHERAMEMLDKLVAEEPSSSAYYARAVAAHGLKRKAQALSDIDNAIRLNPNNAVLSQWQDRIRAMP